tara:strand:- start:739 stop:1149 length:411 start_codon:yes stop_codon:yes gene_type:complete
MSPDDLMKSLEAELANLDASASEVGIDLSGVEPGAELPGAEGAMDAEAEGMMADLEDPIPSGGDAETALTTVMGSGVSDPAAILDGLRAQGFEVVRKSDPLEDVSSLEEAGEEEEEELPLRDATRRAAERAVGGRA